MLLQEWIDIGVDKGIVDILECEERSFEECFGFWFRMKMKRIKPQSIDRIECTYNRYYRNSDFEKMSVHNITEKVIADFLTGLFVKFGSISEKEFGRIYQIVNNVLVYCKDFSIGGAKLIDWSSIKRYIPTGGIDKSERIERPLLARQISRLFNGVINERVYELKQNGCFCILLNFYLGLRIGELAALTWNDIDMENHVVYVQRTETKYFERGENGERIGNMTYCVEDSVKTVNSVRKIPLTADALFILSLLKKEHERKGYTSAYLAYDGTNTILVRSLDRTLRRLCSLLEIPVMHFHLIRKMFATFMHFGGTPTRVISDLMGHKDMDVTENCYILGMDFDTEKYLKYMMQSLRFEMGEK